MQVPTIELSEVSQIAAKKIIEASKKQTTISQQMQMANYYAFLHSPKQANKDVVNFAKILVNK